MEQYISIPNCPICQTIEASFDSYSKPNLYSEKIAMMLGKTESELLTTFANYRCPNCDLVYKKKWFSTDGLVNLFTNFVPAHPKGWDAVANRYSFDNFYYEMNIYEKAIVENDVAKINQLRRALVSMLDSTYGVFDNKEMYYLYEAITNQKLEVFHLDSTKELLKQKMLKPIPFKRFTGFSDEEMWQYIESKIGSINNYSEIGCPLWGMLRLAQEKGIETQFIHRKEPNYWGENCKQNDVNCIQHLRTECKVAVTDWVTTANGKKQVVGFFQYLDHLNDPKSFLDDLFHQYEHAAVILDKVDEPVYIQHFTGFSTKTMMFLANTYGKILHDDFNPILESGNILYLFQ